MMRALGLIAQGWYGHDLPVSELPDNDESLAACVEKGLVACFAATGKPTRLADDVLPRSYVYLLTERGRAEYQKRH